MAFRLRSSAPLVLVAFLTAAGVLATMLPNPPQEAAAQGDQDFVWRRTKDGWEIAWWLNPPKTFHKPSVHPLLFVVCQLAALASLLLLTGRHDRKQTTEFAGDHPFRDQASTKRRIDAVSVGGSANVLQDDSLPRRPTTDLTLDSC